MSSSDRFVYSPADQMALLDQFGHVMKIVNERQRPASKVSQALQAVISDDDIVVVPKVAVTPTGKVFHVTGNAQTAKEAIDGLDCHLKWGLAGTPEKIPMIIQPVDCRARAISLGQIMATEEIYRLYPKMLTPAEFFAFGAKFPEEQWKATHSIVWLDASGQFCCAILEILNGRQRVVDVRQNHPGRQGMGCGRVLVRE